MKQRQQLRRALRIIELAEHVTGRPLLSWQRRFVHQITLGTTARWTGLYERQGRYNGRP